MDSNGSGAPDERAYEESSRRPAKGQQKIYLIKPKKKITSEPKLESEIPLGGIRTFSKYRIFEPSTISAAGHESHLQK